MNGWIEVYDDAPETFPTLEQPILVSFSNAGTPAVGWYHDNAFRLPSGESFVSMDLFPNAWQPLPKCFDEFEEVSCEEQTIMKRCRRLRQIADILRDKDLLDEANEVDIASIEIKELLAKSQVRMETINQLLKDRANG